MIAAPLYLDPPAIVAPEPVRKKRRHRGHSRTVAIGTILLLSDGGGGTYRCQVVQLDPFLCVPLSN